jgi:hypothetical protein
MPPPDGREKQSRQNTGRPGVGVKGTLAALPHFVHVMEVLLVCAGGGEIAVMVGVVG